MIIRVNGKYGISVNGKYGISVNSIKQLSFVTQTSCPFSEMIGRLVMMG
jgi:hypothetical protein